MSNSNNPDETSNITPKEDITLSPEFGIAAQDALIEFVTRAWTSPTPQGRSNVPEIPETEDKHVAGTESPEAEGAKEKEIKESKESQEVGTGGKPEKEEKEEKEEKDETEETEETEEVPAPNVDPLFRTTANVSDKFLELCKRYAGDELQRLWMCAACRKFLRNIGGVVTIDANGDLVSPIWSRTPPPEVRGYAQIIRDLDEYVRSSKVVEFFAVHECEVGRSGEQPFIHFHAELPVEHPNVVPDYQTLDTKSSQVAEAKRMIMNMVSQLNIDRFKKYSQLIRKTRTLSRLRPQAGWVEETYEGVRGRWLEQLEAGEQVPNSVNYAWRAAALAPLGYPHWGSSLLRSGYLLFLKGGPKRTVRYLELQMRPERYQREQAPLKESRLATVALTFAKTGAESALTQRRCTIDDIQELLWKPTGSYEEPATEGNHPSLKEIEEVKCITTADFLTNVLPEAKLAWLDADPSHMTTCLETWSVCTDPDSVPILKWDSEEKRNMVTNGVFYGGLLFSTMGFTQRYTPIVGAARHPAHWNGRQTHLYPGYSLLFAGITPTFSINGMLFKEYINERFREHAGVIERLSTQTELIDESPSASLVGLRLYDPFFEPVCVITMDADGNLHRYKFDKKPECEAAKHEEAKRDPNTSE